MNKTVYPFEILWRGHVWADGYFFPSIVPYQQGATVDILQRWVMGAGLYQSAQGTLLLLPEPQEIQCQSTMGWPVCRQGAGLSSTPLSQKMASALGPQDLLVIMQGEPLSLRLNQMTRLTLADLLDLSDWSIAEVMIAADPVMVIDDMPKVTSNIADILQAPSPIQNIDAIFKTRRPKSASRLTVWPSSVLTSLIDFLKRANTPFDQSSPASYPSQNKQGYSTTIITWWRKLKGWFFRQDVNEQTSNLQQKNQAKPLNDAIMRSLAGKLLRGRQAKYMRRMLQMFEDQDLENALRYAIPLGDNAESDRALGQAMGLPDPRQELRISLQQAGNGRSIYTSDDINHYLRKIYRQAFDKYHHQQNIDRAAFVLAELLNNIPEAVDYLESHGRLKQAAELAEGRGHDLVMAVRLWLKLGEKNRALHIARQAELYLPTIKLLERQGDKTIAMELRHLYAQRLETQGCYEQALEVLMPLSKHEDLSEILARLCQQGVAQGEKVAARMLARQALIVPNISSQLIDSYQQQLASDNVVAATMREEFVHSLVQLRRNHPSQCPLTPIAQKLMTRALRQLVQDRHLYSLAISEKKFKQWLDESGDTALKTDKAKLGKIAQLASKEGNVTEGQCIHIDMASGINVYDVCPAYGDNRFVLALGEAGVDVVKVDSRGKRVQRHFSCVAHQLVIADNGMRALALSVLDNAVLNNSEQPYAQRRSINYKVSILELDSGRSWHYGTLMLNQFIKTYDGNNWFIYQNNRVQLLDMLASKPTVLWSVSESEGQKCVSFTRDSTWLQLYFINQSTPFSLRDPESEDRDLRHKEFECWRYSGNGNRLVARDTMSGLYRGQTFELVASDIPMLVSYPLDQSGKFYLHTIENYNPEGDDLIPTHHSIEQPTSIKFYKTGRYGYLMQIVVGHEGCLFSIYGHQFGSAPNWVLSSEWFFPDATQCQFLMMKESEQVLVWDDRGRVIVLDVARKRQLLVFNG